MKRVRLLAWTVCIGLTFVAGALAPVARQDGGRGRCLLGERFGVHRRG